MSLPVEKYSWSNSENPSTLEDRQQELDDSYEKTNSASSVIFSAQSVKKRRWTSFREKTGFDWLQFIVSVFVTLLLGALTLKQGDLNFQQNANADADRKASEANAEENRNLQQKLAENAQYDKIMSDYLSAMTQLIIRDKLRESLPQDEVRSVARAITLNAARQLDGSRKVELLKFLHESKLINKCEVDKFTEPSDRCQHPVLNIADAKLVSAITDPNRPLFLEKVDLDGALLDSANLQGTYFDQTAMKRVDLSSANLSQATLINVQMERAELQDTNLYCAILSRTTLRGARLEDAVLNYADLRGVDFTTAKADRADFEGAIYDSKTKPPFVYVSATKKYETLDYAKAGMREATDANLQQRKDFCADRKIQPRVNLSLSR